MPIRCTQDCDEKQTADRNRTEIFNQPKFHFAPVTNSPHTTEKFPLLKSPESSNSRYEVNLYPLPRTVRMRRGLCGLSSFWRSHVTCTPTVRELTSRSYCQAILRRRKAQSFRSDTVSVTLASA